jgi:hypothetical protein
MLEDQRRFVSHLSIYALRLGFATAAVLYASDAFNFFPSKKRFYQSNLTIACAARWAAPGPPSELMTARSLD